MARAAPPGQRIDRWLWCARFVKSRSLATRLCSEGRVSLGGMPVQKAHHPVRVGDRLTLQLGRVSRQIEVCALGLRRGPAIEARTLYVETAPPQPLAATSSWTSLFDEEDEASPSR